MAQALEDLFARAQAAIAASQVLIEQVEQSIGTAVMLTRRLSQLASFHSKSEKLYSRWIFLRRGDSVRQFQPELTIAPFEAINPLQRIVKTRAVDPGPPPLLAGMALNDIAFAHRAIGPGKQIITHDPQTGDFANRSDSIEACRLPGYPNAP